MEVALAPSEQRELEFLYLGHVEHLDWPGWHQEPGPDGRPNPEQSTTELEIEVEHFEQMEELHEVIRPLEVGHSSEAVAL